MSLRTARSGSSMVVFRMAVSLPGLGEPWNQVWPEKQR